jgi:type IV pilus assembly protein PilM
MITASRKEKVEDRQGLAEAVGLRPVVIDVESYASRLAASRVIERLPGGADAVIALFEIGGMTSMMHVLRNDEAIYEREQVFGGAQLTQMLVRQYGFTLEEAETKKRAGELPDNFSSTVLEPFVESLAQELERALKFFFTSTPHNRVDYVLLAGGSASLHGLTESVTRHTSFACQVLNPFDGMEMGRGVRQNRMAREAPSYLTACGLAMRRFLR